MYNAAKRPVLPVIVFLALAWYLFFFRLDCIGLTDPDETFYAQTAKEMIAKGDWLTPHIFGKPLFEKPALFYWLVKASFKLFGTNEIAARMPSAIFGAIGLLAVYLLGNLLFSRRVGLIAAVMLGTSVEYVVLARACVTDMVLATLMLLGVLAFFQAHIKGRRHFYLLSAVFFALAVLTKGPVALMLPGLIFALYFIFTGDWKNFGNIPIAAMISVFLVVSAPWYIAMYKVHGSAFVDSFFGFQNITRFMQSEHKIGSQVYYNIPILLAGFFPWSVFLPIGLLRAFNKSISDKRSKVDLRKNGLIFALTWFFVVFIFFTVSSTKLPTYIFPCFFSAALITAVCWEDFLEKKLSAAGDKWMKVSYYALLGAVALSAVAAQVYLGAKYPLLFKHIAAASSILIFGMASSLIAFFNGKRVWTLALIAFSMIIFFYPISGLILPDLDDFETSRAVASELSRRMAPGERLGSESRYMEGLAFYTGMIPQNLDRHHDMVTFLSGKDRVWCVLKEKNHIQLYTLDHLPRYEQDTYMVYKLGKRAIVTNKIPDDGKYLVKRGKIK